MSDYPDDFERWLLPEGIEELLPPHAEQLEVLRRKLLDLFHSWGYEFVIPPLIEYLESLLVGVGHDLDLETFKLTDQLTGRMMGIRADITPQVARIDAHHIKRESPVRLCYLDDVLRTRLDGLMRRRNPLQIGAELYGHSGIESDLEIMLLMVEMLHTTGIEKIHIDMGHVGIFRALAKAAQLDQEQEARLFNALQRKAKPEIETFLSGLNMDSALRMMLISLAELNGSSGVLEQARECLKKADKDVHAALDNLSQIAEKATTKLGAVPLYFDLAELRGYRYQTGVVFTAFVPGHGQEIARGGRYDNIGRLFGRARPATGFSSDLKMLMALNPPDIHLANAILAPHSEDAGLQVLVRELRQKGERVVFELPGQLGSASKRLNEMGCDRRLEQRKGEWVLEKIS